MATKAKGSWLSGVFGDSGRKDEGTPVHAVPMLAHALRWAAQLKGSCLAQPLLALLADCCHRLRSHYTQFVLDRVHPHHRSKALLHSRLCCYRCLSVTVADLL